MTRRHPDRDALERFSRGEVAPEEERWIEAHLRSDCTLCQRAIDELLTSLSGPLPGLDDLSDPMDAGLGLADGGWDDDAAWSRLAERLEARRESVARERQEAPPLLDELLAAPPAQRRPLLRQARFRKLGVCEALIERSFEEGFREPASAVGLAELAVAAAEALDPEVYGPSVVQDLEARAWAYLGNARRVASDLPGAERAMAVAMRLSEGGSADPLEEAKLLDLRASLLCDQGWCAQAAELLDVVIAIYEEIRDPHRRGRALITQGLFRSYAGQSQEGAERIAEGLALIDPAAEPRLALIARHNLAWCVNEAGRSAEALALLETFRSSYADFPDAWTALRLLWLEARIAAGLERFEEAEQSYRELRATFVDSGAAYEASMVTLDLAALYLDLGRSAEVRELAEEMIPLFVSQGVHREALAALITFQRAVAMDRADAGLARRISAYIDRARKNPSLPFDGAGA
jgi:tetratricopeptide (TPR) repeat protein